MSRSDVVPVSLAGHVAAVEANTRLVLNNEEIVKVAAGFASKVTPDPLSGFLKQVKQIGPNQALENKVGARTVTAVKATFEAFQALIIASSNLLLLGRIAMGNNVRGVGAAVITRAAMSYFGWLPTLAFHATAIAASKALPESVNNAAGRMYNWSADTVGTGVEYVAGKVRQAIIKAAS